MKESFAGRTGGAVLAERVARPFHRFALSESAGGIVLLACTGVALLLANSPFSELFDSIWELPLSVGAGEAALTMTLHHWINDGLMVVFFLLVGLEIKREMLVGEFASLRQSALPMAAAAGGMVVPALIFVLFNWGHAGVRGWGIPMATDIAFALGILALVGSRVPPGLKIFLAALAIADDIGAVLVIAIFYTASISVNSLMAAASVAVALAACNRAGVRSVRVYAGLGILLWYFVLMSGVHATVAGVLLALAIPARTRINEDRFLISARESLNQFSQASDPSASSVMSNHGQQDALYQLEESVDLVQSPLLKMERALHATVAFAVIPLFALANAGIRINSETLATVSWRVVLGVVFGLLTGKALGVTLASVAVVRVGVARLPEAVTWRHIHGVSWLAGIGFTMSLFIAGLAYESGPLLQSAKLGILVASAAAGLIGTIVLRRPSRAT